MDKKIVLILSFLILILLISNVLAITASIGNARMVLRAETGDEIEKYILVKNVNNVTVDIELFASGDLEKYIDIKDDKFSLASGEEKKAYFTIEVAKEGTTETKINVQFTPQDGKNGVGLSSTIIVIAEKGSGLLDFDDEENNENNDTDNEVSVVTGKAIEENGISSVTIILLVITGIIFLIFVVLLIIAYKKTGEKRKKENKTKLTKPKRSVKKRG